MKDSEALFIALSNMDAEEGANARNNLVWKVIRRNMSSRVKGVAATLSKDLKGAQEERGVFQPVAGEIIAAEVLFKLSVLEKEETGGND